MMKRVFNVGMIAAFLIVAAARVANAAPISWVDWTSSTINSVTGNIDGIGVTYSGEVLFAQTSGGTNYWNPGTPYVSTAVDNAPPASDIIALIGGSGSGTQTITFSSPVTNLFMAIVSLGQPGYPVTYNFDQPFDVLSYGPGYWGGPGTLTELPGNVVEGIEGHGTIEFLGTFSSLSFTVPTAENWHGFTVGIDPELQPAAPVPEPATLSLLGLGFAASAMRKLRRKK